MMTNDGISVADALALRNTGTTNDGFGGGNGAWWIVIIILFLAMGGWGNRGNGNGNGGDGTIDTAALIAALGSNRGTNGINEAFNFNQLDNGIRGLERGLCDGFYTMAGNLNTLGTTLQGCCCETQQNIANLGYQVGQGFCGVDKSIMQNSFQNQSGFNNLASQLASCCCDLSRGQENIKYAISQAANDIMIANDKGNDRIINYLTQTEMDRLRTELQSAQFQLSQLSQTRSITEALMPVAKPAYITCSPYAAAMGYNGQCCFGA